MERLVRLWDGSFWFWFSIQIAEKRVLYGLSSY